MTFSFDKMKGQKFCAFQRTINRFGYISEIFDFTGSTESYEIVEHNFKQVFKIKFCFFISFVVHAQSLILQTKEITFL